MQQNLHCVTDIWPTQKKLRFSTPPILNIYSRKFYGLVLGLAELIDAKGHKFKNGLKTQKMHFLASFRAYVGQPHSHID